MEIIKPLPVETRSLAPAVQPLVPGSSDITDEGRQTSVVIVDAKIVEVSLDASLERCVLLGYRSVSLAATQVVGVIDCPPQACLPGLPRYMPASSPVVPAPIHREPQKIEGPRPFSTCLTPRRLPEVYQAGLVRLKTQIESAKSLSQYGHHPLSVFPVFETDHEVIGISNEGRFPSQLRLRLLLEPLVQHIVQVDVSQDWR